MAKTAGEPGGLAVKKSICWWCKGRCAVNVYLDQDRLVKVAPDPEAQEGARGSGCRGMRYKNAAAWFYSKHRLNYPLKRAGRRGENKWERIPWEQALDEIARRLAQLREEHGAETLVAVSGDSWTHDEYKTRFLNLFGTPNIIGPGPICMGPRSLVCEAVMGWYTQFMVRPQSRCIVSLGCDISIGRPGTYLTLLEAQSKGAKLITIDPRRTETTARSDIWLQLRPGTDAALLLAMINHIIAKGLYDKDFVEKWCYGFEALSNRVAAYTPEKAAEICALPADQIKTAAEVYATNRPGIFVEGMGVEQQSNAAQIIHARAILAALTGNIDVAGGEELPGPHAHIVTDRQVELLTALTPEQRVKQVAYDKYKLHSWPGQELLLKHIGERAGEKGGVHWYTGQANQPSVYRAILSGEPYPIKAMIASAGNPMVSHANTGLVYNALKKLDLFVVHDLIMTPSSQLADYVLPATSWLERPQLWSYMGYTDALAACQAAVPAQTGRYDRRHDFDLWRGLGIRLGQKEKWPWKTLEESYGQRVKGLDLSFDELAAKGSFKDIAPSYKKYEKQGFATPTGKVELYSTIFEKLGCDPLPYYSPPPTERDPELSREYPLMLINGSRVRTYMHTLWREVDAVRAKHPDPTVQIHPDTARDLAIDDGDWVWIETRMGRIRQRCRYFTGIKPNVVHADGQWWYPELPGEEPFLYGVWLSNANVILDDNPDMCNEITGSWSLRHGRCKVYK